MWGEPCQAGGRARAKAPRWELVHHVFRRPKSQCGRSRAEWQWGSEAGREGQAETREGSGSHQKAVECYSKHSGKPVGGVSSRVTGKNLILHISNGPLTALFICVENNPFGGGQRGRGKTVAVRSGWGFNRVGVMEVRPVNSVHIWSLRSMASLIN